MEGLIMNIEYKDMVTNEQRKAVKLQQTALDLDIPLDECIEIGVNQNSGHTWLFHYDYNFTLYIPIRSDDVWVLTTDNMSGEEFEEELETIGIDTDLIEAWANKITENAS